MCEQGIIISIVSISLVAGTKSEVTPELLDFVNTVLCSEELTHWPVHIWACKNEGLCDDHIRFGLCGTETETKELFLHEVAHALLNPERSLRTPDRHEDSYWHKEHWQGEFKRLYSTYIGAKAVRKAVAAGGTLRGR